ncbi:unnamed protein product [Bursaphelenchus xylophilus]|uniref:(pine wood nematode) hypothetical protein n=1 Tax=Bursaphelenchus xylophilus TaxID=6326 RepID=A0A1I7SCY9_BURXY|nr:unnamed protein product [Bursaphelenchus xylophilus]CAG9093224.1 unnamed protein product [Bursaphelenchus xylophilus]
MLALEQSPQLECLDDGMRLHFVPEPNQPFSGHVYVKGFFFSKNCHLDYSRNVIRDPFFFHVPFKSECQIKREKQKQGTSYSMIVVVQHHPLFITEVDKAYDVSCFYNENQNNLEQSFEINDMTTAGLSDEKFLPDCSYVVVQGGLNGEPVKFANIGETLIHKWSCVTSNQGILVHTCYVRDGAGTEFLLLDDRGCPTNGSLIKEITYSSNLTSAYSPINAFKFADQMIVYFSCQITLCRQEDQGCEGITPPACGLPTIPDRNTTNPDEGVDIDGNGVTSTTTTTTTTTQPNNDINGRSEAQQADPSNIFFSMPFPSARHARKRRENNYTDVTLDVNSDSLIIFTKDENPGGSLAFRMDNICSAAYGQISIGWLCLIIGLVATCGTVLFIQHQHYERRLSNMAKLVMPLEMSFQRPQVPRSQADQAFVYQ